MTRLKVKSIDAYGVVTFENTRTGKDDAGTQDDCLAYGYNYKNSKCYAFTKKRESKYKNIQTGNVVSGNNNKVQGSSNIVQGVSNRVIGDTNTVTTNFSTVIGKNLKSDIAGAITLGKYDTYNTGKQYHLFFSGQTTNDRAIELFTLRGGRFTVDESIETAYYVESKCVALDSTNNEAVLRTSLGLYRYANNTLTEVLDSGFVNSGDSGLSAVVYSIAPVASTPDYIEISVTGIADRTINYNVVLTVTEVTNV